MGGFDVNELAENEATHFVRTSLVLGRTHATT